MMKWIRLTEKEPEPNTEVLFYSPGNGTMNGLINNNGEVKIFGLDEFFDTEYFSHWMPLPEPPAKVQSNNQTK